MAVTDEDGNKLEWPIGVAWSHSQLTKFEQCGVLYEQTNVLKNYPFVDSPASIEGKRVHKMLEDYVSLGAELPFGLRPIKALIDKVCTDALEVLPERDINITHRLTPCTVFHSECSYRGRIDLTVTRPDREAIIFDYKTGKNPDDPDEQIEYQALAILLEKPKITKVHGAYIYTKHPRRWIDPVTREDIPHLVKKITPRLIKLGEAKAKGRFSKRTGVHCKWCPVEWCEFNDNKNLVKGGQHGVPVE